MRVVWLCLLLSPWVGAARLGGTGDRDTRYIPPPGSVLKPFLQGIGDRSDGQNIPGMFLQAPKALNRRRRSMTCEQSTRALTGRIDIGAYSNDFNYDNNLTCSWTLTTPSASDRIILISRGFLLEYSYNCRYDYVEIFDGIPTKANSIGKLCGRKEVRMISKSRKVTIKFKSDKSVTAPGFVFELSRLPSSSGSSSSCNSTITNSQGTITSPGRGPNTHYPNNSTCLYSFKAPPQGQIRLKFVNFSLEAGSCTDDYLTVYDGYTSEAVEIGTYCGRKKPKSIPSSSNSLLVMFHSNSYITSTGFQINYKHVSTSSTKFNVVEEAEPPVYDPACSSVITQPSGNVSSPHFGAGEYYLQKRKCRTVITPPAGRSVKVNFRKFDLEESLDCIYDHVNVTFNKKQDARRTIRLCGYQRRNSLCFISRGNLTLDFTSDVMFDGTGYQADYEFVSEEGSDKRCKADGCPEGCGGYCYNNGRGYACACPEGKVPPDCLQDIAFNTPLKKNVSVLEGTTLELSCGVNHPHIYILWDKDFESSGDEISMIPNDKTPNVEVKGSDLIITRANKSNAGIYTCTVQAGSTILTQSINLTIKEENVFCGSAPAKIEDPNANAAFSKISGQNATKAPSVIPWQVHLWSRKKESHQCGGVLISETHVLTAAHCVSGQPEVWNFKASDYRVSVGTTSCRTAIGAEERSIARYMVHPNYDRNHLKYDFALLELDHPIYVKSDKIYPICLPNSETWKDIHAGFKGLIAGCGKTPKEKGDTPDVLYMVDVPIAKRSNCTRKVFSEDMFCAGGKDKNTGDSCKGDSGGGYTAKIKGRWTLLGLISFGEGCPGTTQGYYANVSYAMDWIQQVAPICGRSRFIGSNSDDSKIIGGLQALPKQFPWVGALWAKRNYECTVTLVGSTWAVTAKHCVEGKRRLTVAFGSLRRRAQNQGSRIVRVKEVRYGTFQEDVALLKLEHTLGHFSDVIQPACLPSERMADNENGVIAGWGTDNLQNQTFPENLLFAEVAKTACSKSKVHKTFLQPSDVCFASSNETVRAYRGDSGVGLIMETQGRHTLGAVYRGGSMSKKVHDPVGYYTDMLDLVPLIKEEMGWIEEEDDCGRGPGIVAEANAKLSPVSDFIPWHAHIWSTSKDTHCGGVLISESHVLTSARCVTGGNSDSFSSSNIRVSLGMLHCSSTDGAVKRKVSRYMLHPQYNRRTLAFDFALLELDTIINQKSSKAFPICLPNAGAWKGVKAGVVTGCGDDSNALKIVKVPIANKSDCPGKIKGDKFCADHRTASIDSECSDFDGGAFVAEVKGRLTLLGLVSFGDSCTGRGFQSYSNVAAAMEWIESVAPICGRSHLGKVNINQMMAKDKQKAFLKHFPWVGALRKDGVEYTYPVTLIGRRWAVTSGSQDGYDPSYSVIFGTSSLNDEGSNSVDIPVSRGIRSGTVTLLELNNSLDGFSEFIQPACLPLQSVLDGEEGLVAGWDIVEKERDELVVSGVRTNDTRLVSGKVFSGSAVMVDINGRQTVAAIQGAGARGRVYLDVAGSVPSIKKAMGWKQD